MKKTLSVRLRLYAAIAAGMALLLAPATLSAQPKTRELTITTSSRPALALFQQARERMDNLETTTAVPLLDEAIQKDPNFAMAYSYRAIAGGGFNVLRQNMDKAVGLADKVSAGERHWILAQQAQFDGNLVKAKQHGDELLKLYPNDKRVAQLAGNFLGDSTADLGAALLHYEKAASLDARFASAYNQIGYAQSRLGDYAAAETAFKQYVTLRPASPNPYDSYGELLMKMGRYDDSIAQYQKALEKDPQFSSAFAGIGHNDLFKGDYAKARVSYQREFDQAPNVNGKTGSLFWTTTSYVHEGNMDGALKSIEQQRVFAAKENLVPTVIGTHEQAAFILVESGDLAGAVKHIEAASKLVEESGLPAATKEAARLRMLMLRARVLTGVHEFDAAKALVGKCQIMVDVSKNPAEVRALEGVLGMLELEQGRNEQALAHFAKADPESAYDLFYTAVAQERKGDKAEAARLYSKVATWNQNDLGYAIVRARARAKKS
jgi:tetratricopeptide (TPR) repeat protein